MVRYNMIYYMNLSSLCMHLCMMPFSIFSSCLDIIDLVNKIKIYTYLIKLSHFKTYIILIIFKSSI